MNEKFKIRALEANPLESMSKRMSERYLRSELIIIAKDIISIKFPFFQEYYY